MQSTQTCMSAGRSMPASSQCAHDKCPCPGSGVVNEGNFHISWLAVAWEHHIERLYMQRCMRHDTLRQFTVTFISNHRTLSGPEPL